MYTYLLFRICSEYLLHLLFNVQKPLGYMVTKNVAIELSFITHKNNLAWNLVQHYILSRFQNLITTSKYTYVALQHLYEKPNVILEKITEPKSYNKTCYILCYNQGNTRSYFLCLMSYTCTYYKISARENSLVLILVN